MHTNRESIQSAPPIRRFREEDGTPEAQIETLDRQARLPLEVHMTDEPGGDPYNHTGRFRRMYR